MSEELIKRAEDYLLGPHSDLVAREIIIDLKEQIEELSRNYNFLRLSDEINWDYEIWGGCYTDEEYDERAILSLSRKDASVDWRKVVEEYNSVK